MKGIGAFQRHQLPHPPCKNPASATGSRSGVATLRTAIHLLLTVCACRERERLVDCYAAFFAKRCGDASRHTLRPLLRMHYAFDFLPPCVAHSPGVAAAAASAPPPTATPPPPGEVSAAEATPAATSTVTSSRPARSPAAAVVSSDRAPPPRLAAASRDLLLAPLLLAAASLRRPLMTSS